MPAYSFLDTKAAIVGPGLVANLGVGAGTGPEGISYEYTEEQDAMTTGADGQVMHSLRASKSGKITVRLLRTSPVNAILQAAANSQMQNGANHGQNTITIANDVLGHLITGQQAGFTRRTPNGTFAAEGGIMEWEFNVGVLDASLGIGS